jgi:alpha-glucuronidase
VFALLRKLSLDQQSNDRRSADQTGPDQKSGDTFASDSFFLSSAPLVPCRVINHWDNITGDIERGYAGKSLFFSDGRLAYDPARIRDYARLLASVGVNIISVNGVNVTPASAKLLTREMLPDVAKLAAIFRDYGIRLALAVHFELARLLGELDKSDPLDEDVIDWWARLADTVYQHIPDFCGFVVKADSEFNNGPMSMGRRQSEGANLIARALKPHGGLLFWRCFTYNCLQDWRDIATDRPMAAYNVFVGEDGLFDDNVILQIKNGPSDFQVREPLSPLFGALQNTPMSLEVQITQEYTGQQTDVYNLATQWEEVLNFPLNETSVLKDIVGDGIKAMTGVSNAGLDENWTGHTLAQLNLYAFGRLAWDAGLSASRITDEWARLTFGCDERILGVVRFIMSKSREAYEKYNAPLALCWMVNPHNHYGPSPEGYEFQKWGTYHRADRNAVGIDRTSKGTKFTAQFDAYLTALFDSVSTCPEEYILYFHRLPYDYAMKDGRTLIQRIYDDHFSGEETVREFIVKWKSLQNILPDGVYLSILERLNRQQVNAREWRDVINTYFYRHSGAADKHGRKIYP